MPVEGSHEWYCRMTLAYLKMASAYSVKSQTDTMGDYLWEQAQKCRELARCS